MTEVLRVPIRNNLIKAGQPASFGGCMAANIIECSGNLFRFYDQKKAKLVDVQQVIAKTISTELREHVGKNIPAKSVRSFIVCTFIGDLGLPFVDIVGFGGYRLLKLRESIGQTFEIDYPPSEHQTEIELTNQEVRE